ncbi:MAG: hypothetical protein O8C66_07520 [Candidatus Methanoperedens sp.]|nr:hypothetical protein [Candidatus Methanoperedens sp.]MCZ7370343.1 hypothetical protein [Candidatus Methanoperedens sp.]
MAKESRFEIILEMLKALQEEKNLNKTQIIQRSYLERGNIQGYLDFLLKKGFIINFNQDQVCYELTEKGENLFKRLEEVAGILG